MPTWPDAASFARDLDRLERDLARDEARRITKDAAEEARKIATRAASRDLGGDPKFSGWAPMLDLNVRSTRTFGHSLTPTRYSAGPWTVAEFGRNQMAGPRVRTGRDGSARRTKKGNVSVVRKRSRWNGQTAGKDTASEAVAEMERKIPPMIERQVTRVMRRRFDVQ
jgi:hypothetical protein